jgi:hypothetical protein
MVSSARPATNKPLSPPTGYSKFQVTGNILRAADTKLSCQAVLTRGLRQQAA